MARLPYPYQEVKWIESTGTQYIDTGVYVSDDMQFELDVQYTDITKEQQNGCQNGNYNQFFFVGLKGYGNNAFTIGTNEAATSSSSLTKITPLDTNRHLFVINGEDNTVLFDNTKINLVKSVVSIPINTLVLFASNQSSTGKFNITNYCKEKIFNNKISINKVLVRNFVPCYDKRDSTKHTAGLYDLVEGKFYGNNGTGYFIVGEDVKSNHPLYIKGAEIPEVYYESDEISKMYMGQDLVFDNGKEA